MEEVNRAIYSGFWRTEDCGVGGSDWPVEPWNMGKQKIECASSGFGANSPIIASCAAHHTQQSFDSGVLLLPLELGFARKFTQGEQRDPANPSRLGPNRCAWCAHTKHTVSGSADANGLTSPWVNTVPFGLLEGAGRARVHGVRRQATDFGHRHRSGRAVRRNFTLGELAFPLRAIQRVPFHVRAVRTQCTCAEKTLAPPN
jgi:hypothetical protein